MDILDLIQSIQNNLFKFLIVFVIAHAITKMVLGWINWNKPEKEHGQCGGMKTQEL